MHPTPRIAHYQHWLQRTRGLQFDRYDALWQWSTTDLHGFWQSIWDYFDIRSPTPHETVLREAVMPGADWFPGAQINFAQQVLRHADAAHAAGHPAIVAQDEPRMAQGLPPLELPWPELRRQVGALATRLQQAGIGPGDRVCAILPNTPATAVAFLACASVGAVWSICSPDMGPVAVLDRFRQIGPKLLLAVDGQVWGGVPHDRRAVLREVLAGLPTLQHLVLDARLPPAPPAGSDAAAGDDTAARDPAHTVAHIALHPAARIARDTATQAARPELHTHALADWLAGEPPAGWLPAWLPFSHPLWVVYSSGTTGLPKPIVHGHGGVVLEMLKGAALHNDIHPSVATGERFHWFSTTGWIMWNAQLGALLGGTTICLFDGNPGGPLAHSGRPHDWGTLWRFAAQAGVTWFGAGAAFYASCLKAGVQPQREGDLSRLQAIGSTGSPLSEECYDWIWQQLPQTGGQRIWLNPISGGTDFAGAFVAGNRMLPVVKGEMQCRCLGAAVQAFSDSGQPLIDAVGELVCTQPMPSMPLFFWGDEGGRRYRDSYFDMFPGVWRHGDWIRITPHPEHGAHGAVIYGRSDATINRHGIRMGTAELYRAVEALPEVLDSLVVDLEYLGRDSWMPLFVVLRPGLLLDDALRQRLRQAIKAALSARHVPDDVYQVAAIPRTLSGKKMELPVKKLLMGADPAQVLNPDAMANAESLGWFVALAQQRRAGPGG